MDGRAAAGSRGGRRSTASPSRREQHDQEDYCDLAPQNLKNWGLTPELAILFGTAVGAVLGLVFGALAIRRQGIYFAMITLALAQMVYFFSLQTPRFTGGEDGIQAVPRGKFLGLVSLADDRALYWLVAAIFLDGVLMIYRIIHSPFGQVFKAKRNAIAGRRFGS